MRNLCIIALLCALSPALSAKTIRVLGDMTLDPNQSYAATEFHILKSGTTLDCQGAVLDGQQQAQMGVRIMTNGEPLRDVTVKNCMFKNYTSGAVRISWKGNDRRKLKYSVTERYRRAPQQIQLKNLTVEDVGKVAVYVDDYVQDVLIDGLTVRRAGGVAVYLEHHSRRTTVQNSVFEQNGFRNGRPAREAIAIDASMNNLIKNNVFRGNAQGGVFLYKNCGEQFSAGKSVLREYQASHNIIEANHFFDMPRGVWLASRQSKNLSKWDCGEQALDKNKTYYEDFARNNTVKGNQFCGIAQPVIVEDNQNSVTDNRYDQAPQGFLTITQPPRERLRGQPVVGTVQRNNQLDAQACRLR